MDLNEVQTMKTTMVLVPSGSIDIVHDGITASIEFNCSCIDALPYCHAQCCRLRTMYAARITPEEFASKKYRLVQQGPLVLLEKDPKTDACVYLDHSKCSIHETKPENCKDWHCSPGGKGEGIKERANGWILLKKEA